MPLVVYKNFPYTFVLLYQNMKTKITSDQLDELIICHKCHTLHKKVSITNGSKALCKSCKGVLYHRDDSLIEKGLALSITGLILFILANAFPLIKVDILGQEQVISILSMVVRLVESEYYIVALFVVYLVFIFPLMIFLIYITLFFLLKTTKKEQVVEELLILLSKIVPWNMSDIFLISILVSLVKLMGMLEIHIGISFWTLTLFVIIDIYMTRSIHIGELWKIKEEIYMEPK